MQGFKKCSHCNEIKENKDFYKNNSSKDGFYAYCKFCSNLKAKRYQKNTYHKRKDILKIYQERHLNKLKKENPEFLQQKSRFYRYNFRKKVILGYGGKCACCGENQYEFLAVDHVDNNGKQDRQEKKNTYRILRYILENKFPKEYQVLCHNCNLSKAFHKYCPHIIN